MSVLEAKVVVLGAQGVGKTSVIHRYVGQMFVRHVSPTIGASFFSCKVNVNEHRIKLLIWDTAGQERFRAMAPMYYRNANAALLMFDITSVDSYQAMKSWVGELQRNVEEPVVLCVVGNKRDMKEARRVNYKEACQFASSIAAFYYETSALSSEGKGLGKNESGITTAIKPSLKFNNYGIGHDVSKQYTSRWWDFAFNKAANSISVVNSETGVSIKRKKKGKNDESKKGKSKLEMNGSFLKAGLLTSDGEISTVLSNSIDEDESLEFNTKETDEELFMRCGGRTAHKAARYGLKMNGKLRRIEQQEESFINNCSLDNSKEKQMCIDSLTDYSSLKCKSKSDAKICNNADVSTNNENPKKKMKKRHHKSKESI